MAICDICGKEVEDFETIGSKVVCSNCIEEHYIHCSECGDLIEIGDEFETYNGDYICSYCRDNDYDYCSECDRLFPNDMIHYDNESGEYYCDECYVANTRIYSYHGFNEWAYYDYSCRSLSPKDNTLYMGCEIEVENKGDENNNVGAKEVYDNINAVCMTDSSIDYGFEIVSQPHTFERYLKEYPNYEKLFRNLIDLGYRGDETDTCGLHIHVSRKYVNEETIDKILLFMENYKEELCNFARRKGSHWCRYISDVVRENYNGENDLEIVKSLEYIKKDKGNHDRYMALNLNNPNTIEFRIFKSTLNIKTFYATLQLVDSIVNVCKKYSVDEIDFNKVVNYHEDSPYLKDYLDLRNIHQSHGLVNNNKLYKDMYVNKYNKLIEVIKPLKNYLRKLITSIDETNNRSVGQEISDLKSVIVIFYNYVAVVKDKRDLYTINDFKCNCNDTIRAVKSNSYINEDLRTMLDNIKEVL